MGEYAKYSGRSIKIGTCEDLYYLRASQARLVSPEPGSLDPTDADVQKVVRFRFPWPDEDDVAPGGFQEYDRGLYLSCPLPADVEHGTVQFKASPGYLASLPCPEGGACPVPFARNGFRGNLRIVQQAYRGGNLAVVCACGGCGYRFSLWTLAEVQPILDAIEGEARRCDRDAARLRESGIEDEMNGDAKRAGWFREVSRRIVAGYAQPVAAT